MLKIIRNLLTVSALFIGSVFALDLNTATVAELKALKGIGQKKAEAIVAYREANGAFKSVDELKKVKGIGDKILEELKTELTVGELKTAETKAEEKDEVKEEVKAEEKKD